MPPYAISSHAEAKHLGADIAIIHRPTSRILLYQAKLAVHDDGAFRLKSLVTKKQLRLLRRRKRIEIDGAWYQITGRLALYQQDLTPYLGSCPPPFMPDMWWWPWEGGPRPFPADSGGWGPAPKIGGQYYETVLARRGCSPSGVLAALVPAGCDLVSSVAASSTWPWEFDAYEWLSKEVPHDGAEPTRAAPGFGGAAPDFGRYSPTIRPVSAPRQAAGIADALAERLRLPASTKLYVIVLP